MIDIGSIKIVVYDGVCGLCSSTVQFILKNNSSRNIYFTSFQSDFGIRLISQLGFEDEKMSTFLFIDKGIVFTKSTGILRVMRYLDGLFPIVQSLIIIPKVFRDFIYTHIANNRYRFLRNRHSCIVIPENLKVYFLTT